MSKTQFEKRRAKSVADVTKEIETKRADIRETASREDEPVYTHQALDIVTLDGGKSYKAVSIDFNPDTGHAKVAEITDISRLVALKHEGQKTALGILRKIRKN